MPDHIGLIRKEYCWYIANEDNLVPEYNGKYVVVKGCAVIGAYDSEKEAFLATIKEHRVGTFIIRKCEPGGKDKKEVFHSRVRLVASH